MRHVLLCLFVVFAIQFFGAPSTCEAQLRFRYRPQFQPQRYYRPSAPVAPLRYPASFRSVVPGGTPSYSATRKRVPASGLRTATRDFDFGLRTVAYAFKSVSSTHRGV